LPPGFGPHEGREIALMRAGAKRLALFVEIWPDDLDAFLSEGIFGSLNFASPAKHGIRVPVRIVHVPGHKVEAALPRELYEEATITPFEAERERRIGRMLSYGDDDIEAYPKHMSRPR
jgi:hypothetical protein